MANLGKCLLFYLKYQTEMERLYETDEPKIEGLPDADRVLKKIRLVGDTACTEGASLLEACVLGIEDHFRSISTIKRVRNNLENIWELRFRVSPKRAPGKRFEIGVSIDEAALFPWVWCRGGRRAEDEMFGILGRGSKAAPSELDWLSGHVTLATIKIPIPECLDEPVALEPLVAEVQRAFTSFTADEVKALAAIARKRDEA